MDKKYFDILEKINNNGYEAYIVGGAVRDSILNREIHDVDITTSRMVDEIKDIFKDYKIVDLAEKFGTIVVVFDDFSTEITTYRIEKDYDGRKPHSLVFSRNILDDLKRRDFTINALIMDKDGEIKDFFNGKEDMKASIIRAIGNPIERLNEDYLRILRAIRFASQLDFDIDEDLIFAIKETKKGLEKISAERIRDEFSKILISDNPVKGLNYMMDLGIFDIIIPEISPMKDFDQETPFHNLDLWKHSLSVVKNSENDLEIRLAAIFHDIGKLYTKSYSKDSIAHYYNHQKVSRDLTEKILKRLRYPNKVVENVCNLANMHMDSMNEYSKKRVKRLLSKYGEEGVKKLFNLHRADMTSMNNQNGKIFSNLDKGEEYLSEILENEEVFDRNNIDINGNDLINIGFKEGKIIGIILDDIEEKVLGEEIENSKAQIIEYVKGRYKYES